MNARSTAGAIEFASRLTCPTCGIATQETMPANACVYFHTCASCKAEVTPKPGDCCVFCSYGSVACPPKQQDGTCACG